MAVIRPFRALRPTPDAAPRVAAVPYDVVSTDEARALADGNPISFLRVTRSEIDLPRETDPYSPKVYAQALANFERIKRDAPLLFEKEPSVYFYRLRMGKHEQIGVAAAYSLDEYDRDLIKKHERTRPDKENDRTRHISELRAQTGVVFLTYRASEEVDAIARRVTASAPLFDFAAPDGVTHTIWQTSGDQSRSLVEAFGRIPALYIADGHHRAASAARTRDRVRGDAAQWFLAVAFPDNQMQILPYNRVVKDLGGLTADAFLARLRQQFTVSDGPAVPVTKGHVAMYLGGKWYTIKVGTFEGVPHREASSDRIASLDVSRLQQHILDPLLGIKDVRTDRRIDFVGGARGTAELQRLVDSGAAAVAFSLFPVTVDDLMAIADAGGIMPPKSTWFEPKLRDGLLINVI